jgi:outer membrane protein TolC
MKKVFSLGLILTSLVWAQVSSAMTLDEYLSQVQKKNRNLQSLESSQEAASLRYDANNLELSPILSAGANYIDDKALNFSTGGNVTHSQVRQYSLGLAKKFSTGTSASIVGSLQAMNLEGTTPTTGPLAAEFHTGTMAFSLTQSLWKDFYGRSTALRWEREASQRQSEKTGYNLQAKQTLISAESAFWDLLYMQNELEIRQASLERAQKIEGWVRRRASNGIGDRADVLNAQGLVAARQLQLISTQDELKAVQKNFALQLELAENEPLPKLDGNLEQVRPLNQFVTGEQGRIMRLDTYLAVLEAKVKKVSSAESAERVRPDVLLQGQYKTNGYDTTDPGAASRMTDKEHPTTSVGVTFSWALDWESKDALRNSARADAVAAELKRDRGLLESQTSWSEINRRHSELSAKITAASKLSEIQTSKAAAERDKLSKGRSITSNVITAEQDAAEAQLTLTKLKAEQRKLESQGRLFVKIQEDT